MIRVLDNDERAAVHKTFSRVFTGTSLRRSVFEPSIRARMLLFPILFQVLEVDQYRTLFAAARALGEHEAYIATYVFHGDGTDRFEDWLAVDLHDEDAYHQKWPTGLWEHAVFSPTGQWGALTTDSEEAFVGGPRAFVDEVRDRRGRDGARLARLLGGHAPARLRARLDPRSARTSLRARTGTRVAGRHELRALSRVPPSRSRDPQDRLVPEAAILIGVVSGRTGSHLRATPTLRPTLGSDCCPPGVPRASR